MVKNWPFDRNERKKARPKFYFFDCGVIRAIQNRLQDIPTPFEKGILFENWLICELIHIRDYMDKEHEFSFWRNRDHEIDIIISDGHGPILAIECKSGKTNISSLTIESFHKAFPKIPLIVASLIDKKPRKIKNIEILPWLNVLEKYYKL